MNFKPNEIVNQFSKHLFWDVNRLHLDLEKYDAYVIKNVLEFGFYEDWKVLLSYYGMERILKTAKTLKDLDVKTVSFLAVKGKVSKDEFLCYTIKASTPPHWNF